MTDPARAQLRARAEAFLADTGDVGEQQPPPEARALVHELGVQQVELEQANQALQARLRTLERERDELRDRFRAAPTSYLILDARGRILDANHRASQLLGVDACAGPLSAFVSTKDAISLHLLLQRTLERGAASCELELLRPDDTRVAAQLDSSRAPGRLPSEARCRVVMTDLSLRRRAELRQRAAELLLGQMGEAVDDVFYVRDARSGRLIYTSPAYDSVWGRPPEVFGRVPPEWPAAVHPQDRERVLIGHRLLLEGIRFDRVYRIVRPDGELRWIHDRGARVQDAGQRYATGIARDVTDERLLRAQLQQAQRLEAIGRLAGGVAHEYNNLLMGIEGCALVGLSSAEACPLQGPDAECPAHVHLVDIRQSTRRGRSLARDLLQLHQPNQDQEVVCVDAVIAKLEVILSRLLGDAIQVHIDLGAPQQLVPLGEGTIEQLLLNLSLNARDAMPEGGELWLATGALTLDQDQAQRLGGLAPGAYITVTVRDTGSGMDADTRERAFDPFFTTKAVGVGTGLGLSTVRAQVVGCGGDLQLESSPGRGACFTLYLPDRGRAPTPADEPKPAPKPSSAPPRRETVLVVEDEPLVLMALRHFLSSSGYEVLAFEQPAAALQACEDHPGPIDLLLTDVSMPGMSGRQLAKKARAQRPQLRVLYMSAYPRSTLLAEQHIEADVDNLEKPFGKKELLQAVRQQFDGSDE